MRPRSKKPEQLCNLEWVMRARSTDEARIGLCAVNATETQLQATDGHRLHLAPNVAGNGIEGPDVLEKGAWIIGKQAGDIRLHDGIYPEVLKVAGLGVDFGWKVQDRARLLDLCRAAEINSKGNPTFTLALPSADGYANVRGDYLRNALEGMNPLVGDIYLAAPAPLQPVVVFQPTTQRRAVIMPIRYVIDPGEGDVTLRWNIFGVGSLLVANTTKVEETAA